MTKTMRTVLDMLAKGAPCYVLPATRRALMRAGLIVYIDDPPKIRQHERATIRGDREGPRRARGDRRDHGDRHAFDGSRGTHAGRRVLHPPDGGVTTRKPRKYAKPIGIALDATTIELGVSQATTTKNKKRHRS